MPLLVYLCYKMAERGDEHCFWALNKLGVIGKVLEKRCDDLAKTAREHGHTEIAVTIKTSLRYERLYRKRTNHDLAEPTGICWKYFSKNCNCSVLVFLLIAVTRWDGLKLIGLIFTFFIMLLLFMPSLRQFSYLRKNTIIILISSSNDLVITMLSHDITPFSGSHLMIMP